MKKVILSASARAFLLGEAGYLRARSPATVVSRTGLVPSTHDPGLETVRAVVY